MLRERSELDRRVVSIALSPLGKKLDWQLFEQRLFRSQTLLARLESEEQETLVALLQKALTKATDPVVPNPRKQATK